MFCDAELAARIERVEADLMARAADAARSRAAGFVIPIAGGIATFAEEGSPFNKVAGLGFAGVPDPAELDQIEDAFRAHGAPVQVELSNLADPRTLELLTARGYRLFEFENVLGRRLEGEADRVDAPGVEVRRARDDELDTWLEVLVEGFSNPDTQRHKQQEESARAVLMRAERDLVAAGAVAYIATRDGVVAGGGLLRTAEGVAHFIGAATAPAHRRRGVQAAMLAARLADARTAGCDLAIVTTRPGSTSQHNVSRRGFDLLYTRANFVK
jgi:GNAT superfamily N-acetyltransferase